MSKDADEKKPETKKPVVKGAKRKRIMKAALKATLARRAERELAKNS